MAHRNHTRLQPLQRYALAFTLLGVLLVASLSIPLLQQKSMERKIAESLAEKAGESGVNRSLGQYRIRSNYIGESYDTSTGGIDTYINPGSGPALKVITVRVSIPNRTSSQRVCRLFQSDMDTNIDPPQLKRDSFREISEPNCGMKKYNLNQGRESCIKPSKQEV